MRVRVGAGDAPGDARRAPDGTPLAPAPPFAPQEGAGAAAAASVPVAVPASAPVPGPVPVLPREARVKEPAPSTQGSAALGAASPLPAAPPPVASSSSSSTSTSVSVPLQRPVVVPLVAASEQVTARTADRGFTPPAEPPPSPHREPSDEPCNSEDEHETGGSRGAAAAAAAARLVAAAETSAAARFQGQRGSAMAPTQGYAAGLNRDRERDHDRDRLGERAFADLLRKKQLVIVPVRPDGNCLFRALAVHVYDTEEEHAAVRDEVLDFVEDEREWFSMFIAEDFARYVRRKRRNGCHGNHLELQAAAELYGRSIEVYAYGAEPFSVIDCAERLRDRAAPGIRSEVEPIRLSFHRGSHYNCVLRLNHARELQRAAAAGLLSARVRVPAAERRARRAVAAAAAAAARRERELDTSSAASSVPAPSDSIPRQGDADQFAVSDLADALATEEEMERAAMALSLAEARQAAARGVGGAGSSSSHSTAAMYNDFMPSSVAAMIDMGFSEERAFEAYVNTNHGSAYDMMLYISRQIIQSKRARSPARSDSSTSFGLQVHGGPVVHEASSSTSDSTASNAGAFASMSRSSESVVDRRIGQGSNVLELESRPPPDSERMLPRGATESRPGSLPDAGDAVESRREYPKYRF